MGELTMEFQVCTIIARNYLAHARVLFASFRKLHPQVPFTVLLVDAPPETLAGEGFDVMVLGDIGLPPGEEARMPLLYNVTELATAVKPWFFRALLERSKTELLYFDPDIEIFSAVDWLAAHAQHHQLVVTPHTTRPMSREEVRPNETDILGSGIYNLGFLGMNRDCGTFLDWWSERLLREAVIDVANMRFTDQRWIDFAPGYFDTFIVRDETCNVAYWNADVRPLTWTGQHYEVHGKPLCFFHYSGFKPEVPHLLSSHQGTNPRSRLSEDPALSRLCSEYAEKLRAHGYDKLKKISYGLSHTPGGLEITEPMRHAYRAALREHEQTGAAAPPTPFLDQAAFIAWLNERPYPSTAPQVTRYFLAIRQARSDIRTAFPTVPGADTLAFHEWVTTHGRMQYRIPDELLPSDTAVTESANGEQTSSRSLDQGVNIAGYFKAEVGTGESGRAMVQAVKETGERYSTFLLTKTRSRQAHVWSDGAVPDQQAFDTNLLCLNADQLPQFAQQVGSEFFSGRYNIGLWFWEAEVFPQPMHEAFNFVHEVWVTSEFNRKAIAAASPVPVVTIPHPIDVDAPAPPPLPSELEFEGKFMFLFCFDFFSVVERKNPIGLIEAFKQAFAPGEGPILLIKSLNGHRHMAELEKLKYARGDRADIILRDEYLTAAQKQALTARCDCYVSLHRAEGFGLTMAEAMLQGKPTIATRYSGNLEFMNDANSFLCGYDRCRIRAGWGPYPPNTPWAEPRIAEAARLMRFVYENPEEARTRGAKAQADIRADYSPAVVASVIKQRLAHLRSKPPASLSMAAHQPERHTFSRVRNLVTQGANIRAIVPPLLTWIAQGPRRAMKECLRAYDQHQQALGLATLDALRELDAESMRERTRLLEQLRRQQQELDRLKKKLGDPAQESTANNFTEEVQNRTTA
jgi:glycosyltransferase involved in cell wall biosynthesis